MNNEKLQRAEAAQSSVARKVLEAVPLIEPWATGRILGELARQGRRYSPEVVEGCLRSLTGDGLVKEVHKGEWQAVAFDRPLSLPAASGSPDGADALAYAAAAVKEPDLLTRLAALSARLRQEADALDELALQAAAEIERARAGSSRFAQLKELLKDVIA